MTGFYDEFVKNITRNHTLNIDKRLSIAMFRTYLMIQLKNSESYESFERQLDKICQWFIPTIRKPQQLVENHPKYYVAWDMYTKTKYICFRDVACLDFDIGKNGFASKQEIFDYVDTHPWVSTIPTMRIETRNGVHVFLLDKYRPYHDKKWIFEMLQLKIDGFYGIYCHLRGYSIRLNPKSKEEEHIMGKKTFTHLNDANQELLEIANKQFDYVERTFISEMS